MRLVQLSRHSIAFPLRKAPCENLMASLALGGDLSPRAAADGLSAWYFSLVFLATRSSWWSPDPRAVLWPEQFHLSRSMKRFHQRSPYRVTLNHAFGEVIEGLRQRS